MYAQNFDRESFNVFDGFHLATSWTVKLYPVKLLQHYRWTVKETDHPSKILFYQIFDESVSVKICPHQNFTLYGTLN